MQGPEFVVLGDSIKVDGPSLTASLHNQRDGVDLLLSLKAYSDGFVRMVRLHASDVTQCRTDLHKQPDGPC